jgi:hypothetical protein
MTPRSMIEEQHCEATPMLLGIPELLLRPLRPAQEQLRVALPGEAHAAVELHGAVRGELERLRRLRLGHATGRFRIGIKGGRATTSVAAW